MATSEGIQAPELPGLLSDMHLITRLTWVSLQAFHGTEAGFAISRYPGTDFIYSQVLMPETATENEAFDPEEALGINEFRQKHKPPQNPRWEMLIHGHPGRMMQNFNAEICPSFTDIKLLSEISSEHPGHIGGIVTVSPGFLLRLVLYRAAPEGINLDALSPESYPGKDFDSCASTLALAGVKTARILYGAGQRREWYGKPEQLYEL